jgi:DNA-binding transcriptional ArsR family regulator
VQEVDHITSPATCEETGAHPEEVEAALAAMPEMEDVQNASELLKVVGDPTRMRILSALMSRELCVCDIQVVLGMSQSAISHQLRVLRASNLVRYRRAGKMAYYSLADHHVMNLLQMSLDHVRHSR